MLRARFLSANQLELIDDAARKCLFLKKPDLQAQLMSGPCVAAALSLVHGVRTEHTMEECYDTIEDYVQGGDGGETRRIMR